MDNVNVMTDTWATRVTFVSSQFQILCVEFDFFKKPIVL